VSESAPVQTHRLFIGMTRPPMVMGVPTEFFGLSFILFGTGMVMNTGLIGMALFVLFVSLPLYGFGYWMTTKEPSWMRIFLTKMALCEPAANKNYWGCNSFAP
jgi:type IV secretion system protein VirB3